MPWDRWEEQSVYFCEVVCRDVLLPAVASHTTAASSTPRDLRLQSSAVPARIRRSDEMPHGSAAPRCAHDASLLVTSLKPRVAGRLAPPLLPPLQAAQVASGRRIGIVWRPREERRKAR